VLSSYDALFFEWVEGWVRASPDAAWTSIQVAAESVAAAVRQDTRWLVRHHIGWINHLCLQTHFLVDMLTILNFQDFPGFFGHGLTPGK
jgi:hypothetical protein